MGGAGCRGGGGVGEEGGHLHTRGGQRHGYESADHLNHVLFPLSIFLETAKVFSPWLLQK